ncbi:MAG: glutamate racemase, partial [Pseudomonadota bacterium]
MADTRPIGVFDSGMGGLTVLRALNTRLPGESFVYLGDTARLPYGTKSPDTVRAYALQATHLLLSQDVKMVVIACNTASAVALDALR